MNRQNLSYYNNSLIVADFKLDSFETILSREYSKVLDLVAGIGGTLSVLMSVFIFCLLIFENFGT